MTLPTPNRLSPEERYHRDAQFHLLVNVLYDAIRRCEYTPTEIREAALLAAIKHEERRPIRAALLATITHEARQGGPR